MFLDVPAVGGGSSRIANFGGGIADQINNGHFADLRRPYFDRHGRPSVTINLGRTTAVNGVQTPIKEHITLNELYRKHGIVSPVANATSLSKEQWVYFDSTAIQAARYRMQAWADLSAANTFGGFDGMASSVLEYETISDSGEALVDMSGLTPGRNDEPRFQLEGVPLPIIHSDFEIEARQLAMSRKRGTPLSNLKAEQAGRRVGEAVEKLTIGNYVGPIYGGDNTQAGGYGRASQVYGYLNFPSRLTKTNMTTPTGSNASTTLSEILSCLDQLKANKFFGPFMIYTSNDWDAYLDSDYILTGGNVATQTLRNRLRAIEGIADVKRLDMLFATKPQTNQMWTTTLAAAAGTTTLPYRGPGGEGVATAANPFTMIFVQLGQGSARAVNGMGVTTVQWEERGGMLLKFMVMCIQVPQLFADFYGNCGILHASVS